MLSTLLMGVIFSPVAWSLGLGEIRVQSAINEPFSATIPVTNPGSLDAGTLIVSIANTSQYDMAGVRWSIDHADLQFEVDYTNAAAPLVRVFSARAVREPYLNFLVQARWPAGSLLREYTVLLDFRVFGADTSAAPAASAPRAADQPINQQQFTPQTAPAQAPAPRQAVAPSAPVGNAGFSGDTGSGYRIQTGDTLWGIAGSVANQLGVSRHQAMMAIRQENPDAFIDGNLNMLKAGSVLRTPSRDAALSRSETQAVEDFRQAVSGPIQGTPMQTGATGFRGDTAAGSSSAQFGLAGSTAATSGGGAAGTQANLAAQQTAERNAALQEELDAARIQNEELQARLANLQEQIEVQQRLLEVENTAAAQVQQAVTESTAPAPIASPAPQVEVSVQQPTQSNLINWLLVVGVLVLGLAGAAFMVMRRKSAESRAESYAVSDYHDGAMVVEADADYTDDEDAAIPAAAAPMADATEDEFSELDDPEESALDGRTLVLNAAPVAAAPAADDWASDFDDLDAFFNDDTDGSAAKPLAPSTDDDHERTVVLSHPAVAEPEKDDFESLDLDISDLEADDLDADVADAESAESSHSRGLEDLDVDFQVPEQTTAQAPSHDQPLDEADGLDFSSVDMSEFAPSPATPSTTGADPSSHDNDLEFSIDDWQKPAATLVPVAAEAPALETDEEDEFSLDFEIDDIDLDAVGTAPSSTAQLEDATLDEVQPLTAVESPDSSEDLDSLLNGDDDDWLTDLGMTADTSSTSDDSLASDETAADAEEEFETKLELAAAYLEMGDKTGARELLDEVLSDATGDYKVRAEELLGKL